MESKDTVTTLYQCSECDHCSQNLEEATLHAVQVHGEDKDDTHGSDDEFILGIKKHEVMSDEEYDSASGSPVAYKQANGSGSGSFSSYRKSERWPVETTKLLIKCVSDHFNELSNKLRKRKDIWEDIHKVVSKSSPDITAPQCEQKWRNLINAQKKYLSAKNSYGKSCGKKPDYYHDINSIVGSDILNDKDTEFALSNETRSYRSARIRERKSRESDSLTTALKNLLDNDEPEKLSIATSDKELLTELISILQKREASNLAFQKEILEIEREKLSCIKKFVEGRERFNAKRLQLIRECMYEKSKKRRFDED